MRSRALLTVLMGWLFLATAIPVPARAQATPEQLNRLSLDALTAPPPAAPRRYSPAPQASHGSYRAHAYRGSSRPRSTRSRSYGTSSFHSKKARRSYAPAHRGRLSRAAPRSSIKRH